MDFPLTWDDSYEIALELRRLNPQISIEDVSIDMIYRWTVALPRFQDDVELVNDDILQAIYREWFEEVISND
jgi:FeS assembly protein IscX